MAAIKERCLVVERGSFGRRGGRKAWGGGGVAKEIRLSRKWQPSTRWKAKERQ